MNRPNASDPASEACPYRGLVPYFEADADYFFGRKSDTEIIVANCLTTRITLFYGASGVGKSSVLYAGVVRELQLRARKNLTERNCAEAIAIPFSSWRDDPSAGLQQRIEAIMRDLLPETPASSGNTLLETLRAWTELTQSDLVLLLDQFEEYFLYRDAHDTSFGDELIALVNDAGLRVNVLISLREDALAQLDTFKSSIPALFDNCLRLEHLTEVAARAAIEKPLQLYNQRQPANSRPVSYEPSLVDEVIEQVRAGRVRLRAAGAGSVKTPAVARANEARVEAPYLQMVMIRLWREDVVNGDGHLRSATLHRLGGAQQIVRTHLDSVMERLPANEQALAARVFHHLVTPSGAKIAHYVDDLAEYTGTPADRIQRMFDRLDDADARVLRDVTPPRGASKRYEIFHDLLAAPILDWRQRFVARQQNAKSRRTLALAVMTVVAGALAIILILGARSRAKLTQQKIALQEQEKNFAVAKEAATELSRSQQQLSEQLYAQQQKVDGESAAQQVVIQKEALADVPAEASPEPRTAAPAALPSADVSGAVEYITEKIFLGHTRDVWSAAYGPPRAGGSTADKSSAFLITAGRDQTTRVWDLRGDNDFAFTGHAGEVNDARLNPNPAGGGGDWFAATASDDSTVGLWKKDEPAKPFFLRAHTAAVSSLNWSKSGQWLVSTSRDHTALIWDVRGQPTQPFAVLNKHTGSVWSSCLVENDAESWLATASGDRTARLWSFPSGKPATPDVFVHGAPVRRVAMDDAARWLLTAGNDGRAVLWDRQTGTNLLEVIHGKAVRDVAFKPESDLFVTASADGTAQVWNAKTLKPIVRLAGHTAPVFSARFTPYGPGVVTASWDKTARLWNYETKKCVAILRGHLDVLWSIRFAPSGRNFTTTSADGTARLWELNRIEGAEAFLPPEDAHAAAMQTIQGIRP